MQRFQQLLAALLMAVLVTPTTVGASLERGAEQVCGCCGCDGKSLPGCDCVAEDRDRDSPVQVAVEPSPASAQPSAAPEVIGEVDLPSPSWRALPGRQEVSDLAPPGRYAGRSCVLRL